MGSAENSTPEARGKREMQELVRGTFAALEAANLGELVGDLRERVFVRDAEELLETTMEQDVCHYRFKPMVELLLLHVRELAANSKMPVYTRRGEIAAAVELAGF